MSAPADMSPEAIFQRRRESQALDAANGMIARANALKKRAGRAPRGSNERAKAMARAKHLHACALMLAAEHDFQVDVERQGLFGRGWKAIEQAVAELARKRQSEREQAEAPKR